MLVVVAGRLDMDCVDAGLRCCFVAAFDFTVVELSELVERLRMDDADAGLRFSLLLLLFEKKVNMLLDCLVGRLRMDCDAVGVRG